MTYHAGMSRFAPLLRALLCLVLLLNGTAYAHAATRMAMGGTAAMEQAHDDVPPCHESMDMAMQVDEEAAYSASNEVSAAKVAKAAKALGPGLVIDATACIGGNTIAFARNFRRVVAIEIDPKKVRS